MKRPLKLFLVAAFLASQAAPLPVFAAGPAMDNTGLTSDQAFGPSMDPDGFSGCFWLWSLFGICK